MKFGAGANLAGRQMKERGLRFIERGICIIAFVYLLVWDWGSCIPGWFQTHYRAGTTLNLGFSFHIAGMAGVWCWGWTWSFMHLDKLPSTWAALPTSHQNSLSTPICEPMNLNPAQTCGLPSAGWICYFGSWPYHRHAGLEAFAWNPMKPSQGALWRSRRLWCPLDKRGGDA